MPFYLFEHSCGYKEMLRRVVGEHILDSCPSCHAPDELRPVLNRSTAPNVMLPAVSNQYYNNGHGKYDPGLGETIYSREHHKQVMEQKGVTEFRGSQDDFMQKVTEEKEPQEATMEEVKDAFAESSARVKNGERWEDTPNPNPELVPREI